ncbi:uncharacterized protein BX664DRAFT_313734 [Halteromyces radiatus]|uniref:uncharacterized protein n=1 Tax=Halteromyces radiatus TaxID=101107 RepID=UPI00221E5942|nr:uncharacterized protein BX664DRAFT_313734 [Halteromyces radiatus]KAI8093714.1 hypothetical protein BX664DRAFT_313734 [Halteromyces radiatus]
MKFFILSCFITSVVASVDPCNPIYFNTLLRSLVEGRDLTCADWWVLNWSAHGGCIDQKIITKEEINHRKQTACDEFTYTKGICVSSTRQARDDWVSDDYCNACDYTEKKYANGTVVNIPQGTEIGACSCFDVKKGGLCPNR